MRPQPYPDFEVGGIYEFAGEQLKREYGQWTVVSTEGGRIMAVGTANEFRGRTTPMCMVDTNYGPPSGTQYNVIRVDDEPVIEEDWT